MEEIYSTINSIKKKSIIGDSTTASITIKLKFSTKHGFSNILYLKRYVFVFLFSWNFFVENAISGYFNNSSTDTEFSSDLSVGERRRTPSPYF